MALEMVSPTKKFSQRAYRPSFSRDGERVAFKVEAAVADTPSYLIGFGGDVYIGSRGASGWGVAPTAPLAPTIIGSGMRLTGNVATFTPDLGRWTQLGSTQAQYNLGITRLFGGGLDGSFEQLSSLLVPIDDSGPFTLSGLVDAIEFGGSSANLELTVLRLKAASTAYFPDDPRGATVEAGSDRNSYLAFSNGAGEPTLELLARDKDDKVWGGRCGAHLGGEDATFNQGAISPDGNRIFFTTRPDQEWDEEELQGPPCDLENGLRVMERVSTSEGPAIAELAPPKDAPGDDFFQAASADGSKVYFTSPRKLTGTDVDATATSCSAVLGASKGCDLYLYDANRPEGERIVQASAGDGPGPADVLSSIAAVSGDGSRAYFVAQKVLNADPNPEGDFAQEDEPNLYLYEAATETLSFIGTLAAGDAGGMWGTKGTLFGDAYAAPLYGPDLKGGGDGHVLALASKAPLTEDDEDGGFRDVFRYDAEADALERISKAAGGSDSGEFDASVNPATVKGVEKNFGEMTRWVSEDGELIAFATAEPLIAGDTDGLVNPYVWDAGQLGAVFAELNEQGGVVKAPGAAPVGDQLVFSTPTDLLPRDGDGAEDIYVARANGGFADPDPPPVCDPLVEGDCKGPPSPKPASVPPPAAGTNVKPAAKCKKGKVRKKGKCVPRKGKGEKRRGGSR